MMNENGRMNDMETMEKGIEYKTTGEILIISAVVMYIVGTFSFLILPFGDNMNIFVFGVIIAAATGTVIYGGFQLSNYKKLNEKNEDEEEMNTEMTMETKRTKKIKDQRKESISTMFSMIATISYLYIGFMYGLWHPGWIIFLLIPAANAAYDLFRTRENY